MQAVQDVGKMLTGLRQMLREAWQAKYLMMLTGEAAELCCAALYCVVLLNDLGAVLCCAVMRCAGK